MNREDALRLIDNHKNALLNPVEMLSWTWLRVSIAAATEEEWAVLLERAMEVMSQ